MTRNLDPCAGCGRVMCDCSAFNEEQQIVIAILRQQGYVNPEQIVASERFAAAVVGSKIMPALKQLAHQVVRVVEAMPRG